MRTSTLFFTAAVLSLFMVVMNAIMLDGFGGLLIGGIFGATLGYNGVMGYYSRKKGD